jgi:hypothetical protein
MKRIGTHSWQAEPLSSTNGVDKLMTLDTKQGYSTKITVSFLLVFGLAFLISCSSNPEKTIIGEWSENENPGVRWTFHKDGTLSVTEGERSGGGEYVILGEDTIKIITFDLADQTDLPMRFIFSVSGDELLLSPDRVSNGSYFTRVK